MWSVRRNGMHTHKSATRDAHDEENISALKVTEGTRWVRPGSLHQRRQPEALESVKETQTTCTLSIRVVDGIAVRNAGSGK